MYPFGCAWVKNGIGSKDGNIGLEGLVCIQAVVARGTGKVIVKGKQVLTMMHLMYTLHFD